MRYFFDTEFSEDGRTIELISIGIVAEDGREYYAISAEFDPYFANKWVFDNVIAQLETDLERLTRSQIAREILDFIGTDNPEIWAYYADYDWVVLCQLFGRMIDLPKGWPMFCRDLKQLACDIGNPKLPEQGKGEHNALSDARWNKLAWELLHTRTLEAAP